MDDVLENRLAVGFHLLSNEMNSEDDVFSPDQEDYFDPYVIAHPIAPDGSLVLDDEYAVLI